MECVERYTRTTKCTVLYAERYFGDLDEARIRMKSSLWDWGRLGKNRAARLYSPKFWSNTESQFKRKNQRLKIEFVLYFLLFVRNCNYTDENSSLSHVIRDREIIINSILWSGSYRKSIGRHFIHQIDHFFALTPSHFRRRLKFICLRKMLPSYPQWQMFKISIVVISLVLKLVFEIINIQSNAPISCVFTSYNSNEYSKRRQKNE